VQGVVVLVAAIAMLAIVVLLIGFNRLVRGRNLIDQSWHGIDAELQRRYDLVPNLVSTVKGYATHEREVLESVTALRVDAMAERRPPDAQAPREQALGRGVSQLMAVAEGYPDLKADTSFLALQRALVDNEDRIQVARRIYNANVRSYDTMVQSFPSLIVARMFNFGLRPYFEVESAVRDAGPPAVELPGQS
jgi:LemA protein